MKKATTLTAREALEESVLRLVRERGVATPLRVSDVVSVGSVLISASPEALRETTFDLIDADRLKLLKDYTLLPG